MGDDEKSSCFSKTIYSENIFENSQTKLDPEYLVTLGSRIFYASSAHHLPYGEQQRFDSETLLELSTECSPQMFSSNWFDSIDETLPNICEDLFAPTVVQQMVDFSHIRQKISELLPEPVNPTKIDSEDEEIKDHLFDRMMGVPKRELGFLKSKWASQFIKSFGTFEEIVSSNLRLIESSTLLPFFHKFGDGFDRASEVTKFNLYENQNYVEYMGSVWLSSIINACNGFKNASGKDQKSRKTRYKNVELTTNEFISHKTFFARISEPSPHRNTANILESLEFIARIDGFQKKVKRNNLPHFTENILEDSNIFIIVIPMSLADLNSTLYSGRNTMIPLMSDSGICKQLNLEFCKNALSGSFVDAGIQEKMLDNARKYGDPKRLFCNCSVCKEFIARELQLFFKRCGRPLAGLPTISSPETIFCEENGWMGRERFCTRASPKQDELFRKMFEKNQSFLLNREDRARFANAGNFDRDRKKDYDRLTSIRDYMKDWFCTLGNGLESSILCVRKDIWLMWNSNWLVHRNYEIPTYEMLMKHWKLSSNGFKLVDSFRKFNVIRKILSWISHSSEHKTLRYALSPGHVDFEKMCGILFKILDLFHETSHGLEESLKKSYRCPQENSMLKSLVSMILIRKTHILDRAVVSKILRFVTDSNCVPDCHCLSKNKPSPTDEKTLLNCKIYRRQCIESQIPNLVHVLDTLEKNYTLQDYIKSAVKDYTRNMENFSISVVGDGESGNFLTEVGNHIVNLNRVVVSTNCYGVDEFLNERKAKKLIKSNPNDCNDSVCNAKYCEIRSAEKGEYVFDLKNDELDGAHLGKTYENLNKNIGMAVTSAHQLQTSYRLIYGDRVPSAETIISRVTNLRGKELQYLHLWFDVGFLTEMFFDNSQFYCHMSMEKQKEFLENIIKLQCRPLRFLEKKKFEKPEIEDSAPKRDGSAGDFDGRDKKKTVKLENVEKKKNDEYMAEFEKQKKIEKELPDSSSSWLKLGGYVATRTLYEACACNLIPPEMRKMLFLSLNVFTERVHGAHGVRKNKKRKFNDSDLILNIKRAKLDENNNYSARRFDPRNEFCDDFKLDPNDAVENVETEIFLNLGMPSKKIPLKRTNYFPESFSPAKAHRHNEKQYLQYISDANKKNVDILKFFFGSQDSEDDEDLLETQVIFEEDWLWEDQMLFGKLRQNVLLQSLIAEDRYSTVTETMRLVIAYVEGRYHSNPKTFEAPENGISISRYLMPRRPIYHCIQKKNTFGSDRTAKYGDGKTQINSSVFGSFKMDKLRPDGSVAKKPRVRKNVIPSKSALKSLTRNLQKIGCDVIDLNGPATSFHSKGFDNKLISKYVPRGLDVISERAVEQVSFLQFARDFSNLKNKKFKNFDFLTLFGHNFSLFCLEGFCNPFLYLNVNPLDYGHQMNAMQRNFGKSGRRGVKSNSTKTTQPEESFEDVSNLKVADEIESISAEALAKNANLEKIWKTIEKNKLHPPLPKNWNPYEESCYKKEPYDVDAFLDFLARAAGETINGFYIHPGDEDFLGNTPESDELSGRPIFTRYI